MVNLFFSRHRCPICDSSDIISFFKHGFNDSRISQYMNHEYNGNVDIKLLDNIFLEFCKCNSCTFKFQKTVFNEENLHYVYDKWMNQDSTLEDHKNNGNWKVAYYKRILSFAKYFLQKDPTEIKFLDYGAGFGESLFAAKQIGFDCYALEYAQYRIEYLERAGISVIDDTDKNTYDFIILDQVLEHSTFPSNILKTLHSKLKQNGLLYLAVPNCYNFENKVLKAFQIYDYEKFNKSLYNASVGPFQHINFFNNSNLKYIIKKNGFKRVFPTKMVFMKPVGYKTILRPIYHYFFGTVFFLQKV